MKRKLSMTQTFTPPSSHKILKTSAPSCANLPSQILPLPQARTRFTEAEEDVELKTLTIFDFDNTLFPTTYIVLLKQTQKVNSVEKIVLDTKDKLFFAELDRSVLKTLQRAELLSEKSVIITNGTLYWVKIVTQTFMPMTHRFLFNLKQTEVVSARDAFIHQTKNQIEWKKEAFLEVIEDFYEEDIDGDLESDGGALVVKNIISIGDGLPEIEAMDYVCRNLENCFQKIVKFRGRHTCSNVRRRVDNLCETLDEIEAAETNKVIVCNFELETDG